MPGCGRQAAMVAVLLLLVLGLASFTPGHAISQMKARGGDMDDGADLMEGIVGEDLPDDFDGEDEEGDFDADFDRYEDEPDADADEHWREEEEEFFKKYDTNGDGNLDLEEYTKLLQDEWHAADANGDEAAITAGGDNEELDRMKEHFAEEDQNNDGKISLEEWIAVAFHDDPQEAAYEDGERGGNFEQMTEEELAEIRQEAEKEFESSDKDKDGKLTLEEIVELVLGDIQEDEEHDIDKNELAEMAKQIFNEMDKNNDTIVDFEEFFKSHMMDPSEFDDDMMHDYYGDESMHEHGHYGLEDDDVDPEDDDDDKMLPGGDDFDIDGLADDRDIDDIEAQQH